MRSLTSILLLVASISSIAQRVEFNDPDLTFSFKKPSSWELIDNGYVVMLSPSLEDTATTYLTITYFEPPSPIGISLSTAESQMSDPNVLANQQIESEEITIAEVPASMTKSELESGFQILSIRNYRFKKLGQDWEIVTGCPMSEDRSLKKIFRKIIKSLKVSN